MKQTAFFILMAFVLWMTSCSKDNEGSGSLVGEWDYVAYIVNGQYSESDNCGKNAYIIFTETNVTSASYNIVNGICTSDVRQNTYTVLGDKLVFMSGSSGRESTYSITGDELRIHFINDDNQQSTSIYKRRNGTATDAFVGNWALKKVIMDGQEYDITGANFHCFKNSTLTVTKKTFSLTVSSPIIPGSTQCKTTTDAGTWSKRNGKYYISQNGQEEELLIAFTDGNNVIRIDYMIDDEVVGMKFAKK